MNYTEAVKAHAQELKKATILKLQGDYEGALTTLSNYLHIEEYPDLKREIYHLMASFKYEQGKYEEAKDDLIRAISLAPDVSHARYGLEQALGNVHETLGQNPEAVQWYKKALNTVSEGSTIASDSALLRFINIVGEANLTDEDRALCNEVATKSWKLLRIEGEPDLTNLSKTAEIIIEAQGKPRPRE